MNASMSSLRTGRVYYDEAMELGGYVPTAWVFGNPKLLWNQWYALITYWLEQEAA